jgi:hypothetical protein
MSKSTSAASGGIGFFGLLTIALIILKLIGMIEISWLAIVGVFFAPILIVLGIMGIILVVALIKSLL